MAGNCSNVHQHRTPSDISSVSALAAMLFLACSHGVEVKGQYSLSEAFPNLQPFTLPVELVNAGDGTNRLFVVQQRGVIRVFENSSSVASSKIFLDLSDRVSQSGSETGLLGLAFHPRYLSNRYFYVNYTTSIGGQLTSVVSRFQTSSGDADIAIKESEFVLMTVAQPFSNHNGGCLRFGPDGYLYVALGDGGSANDPQNHGQNRTTLLGSILRLDVDNPPVGRTYGIPADNPFAGNSSGYREEIFAYGLRNPWKMSFDRATGSLWAGDVGQGAREEIDIIVNGGNYGWRLMEGFLCTPNVNPTCQDTAGLLRPVWDYGRSDGISITGGYVYRGSSFPDLSGKYLYGDFGSGRIWALAYDGISLPGNQLLVQSPHAISSFGEDEEGELLVVSYQSGRLYRLSGPPTSVGRTATAPAFALHQNYPNPFNATTLIRYSVPAASGHGPLEGKNGVSSTSSLVTLKVFNLRGQEVATLVNGLLEGGNYEVMFDARSLASGVYIYQLFANSTLLRRTMMLLR